MLIHAFATLFMVGPIWIVQVVRDPLFSNGGSEHFKTYEELHQRLTTWVVGPAMLLELATAVFVVNYPQPEFATLAGIGLALIIVIWLATALLSVPAHNSLTIEYTTAADHKLVATNWIRTVAWTARGVLVLAIIQRAMK